MQAPPVPPQESQRLQVLRELLILDTEPEQRFDRLVAFASQEFDVPIALVSLVDENRQWFKARAGLEVCETPREISFCGHAILTPDIMVVPDAPQDSRFADNPLVTGPPFVRFYAGAPLRLPGGAAIGTFCLLDPRPRSFDAVDHAILGALRDLAVEEIQRRSSERQAP